MPSLDENKTAWDGGYDWTRRGEEWSDSWGGSETQWYTTLYPRLRPFLPTGSLCEIAPGYGRWTGFLLEFCDEYVGIDLSSQCIDSCRERFAGVNKARFEITDGWSLPTVEKASVDFAFSFDSLVHVEPDVIAAYLGELARVLTQDGIAWLHHSNLGEFSADLQRIDRITNRTPNIPALRRAIADRVGFNDHWRDRTMTAARMLDLCREAGLVCVGQELINWGGRRLIDCISVITRPGSPWDRPLEIRRNENFCYETQSAKSIAAVFSSMSKDTQQRPSPQRTS